MVLPYQELLGNYNKRESRRKMFTGFTIPRTARELQRLYIYLVDFRKFYHTKNC